MFFKFHFTFIVIVGIVVMVVVVVVVVYECVCVYMLCVYRHMCMCVQRHRFKAQNNSVILVLSFHSLWILGLELRSSGLCDPCPYQLKHLAALHICFYKIIFFLIELGSLYPEASVLYFGSLNKICLVTF